MALICCQVDAVPRREGDYLNGKSNIAEGASERYSRNKVSLLLPFMNLLALFRRNSWKLSGISRNCNNVALKRNNAALRWRHNLSFPTCSQPFCCYTLLLLLLPKENKKNRSPESSLSLCHKFAGYGAQYGGKLFVQIFSLPNTQWVGRRRDAMRCGKEA